MWFQENHVKNSTPFDEIIVEEIKPENTEETEIIAAVTGIPASTRAQPAAPPADAENVKTNTADEVFDADKWNKIWNTSNDLSDDDSDASSKIDETVVQIHESSTEETEETVETSESLGTAEVSYSEVPITKVEIVIQLPDAVPVSEESTSDADSLSSENIPRPMSPVPPPMPSVLRSPSPERRNKPSEDIPLAPPAPTLRASAPPITSRPPITRDFQEELKTTLRLRNQRQIEQIENTAINVSEGIQIFGGKRSRTTSINKGDNDNSIKSAMKAGRFDDPQFVYKLNNILQGQVTRPSSEQWRKSVPANYNRQKEVVLVDQDGVSDQRPPQSSELAARMQQMRGTLEQILGNSRRSSSRLSDAGSDRLSVAPTPPRPPSRVHKSLDSLGPSSEVQIVSRN